MNFLLKKPLEKGFVTINNGSEGSDDQDE